MNPADAWICAKASEAVYGTAEDPAGQTTSQEKLAPDGFSICAWVSLETLFKEVCAFVASSPDYNLLVFRGTKEPQYWIQDLYCTPACLSFGDFFEIISHVRVDVGDHSMTTYRQLVQENREALGALLQ